MPAEGWEYRAVGARAESFDSSEALTAARAQWIDSLNARGTEGWDLVSERFASGYYQLERKYWASYSGTMKRARQQS